MIRFRYDSSFLMPMRVPATLLTCLFLAACGTKGPLFLPPKPATVSAPPQQAGDSTTQQDHSKANPKAGQ
jgi:predicted small lipoprotein YifL